MRARLLGFLILALAPSAHAQPKAESVIALVPDGFKVGHQQRNATMTIAEFIPENETVDEWSEMVTILIIRNKPPSIQDFVDGMIERYSACATHEATQIEEGQTNGYPSALWRLVCGATPDTHKPEFMYMKLIYGADAFYVVQDAFRDVPSADHEVDARLYMKEISACDPSSPDHPCPAQ